MPGPAPTPTTTLAARGSWRAKTRPDEPKPEVVTDLKPPTDLTGEPRKLWKRLAPKLVAAGILTTADVESFARYCRLYVAWKGAMTAVESNPVDRASVLALGKLDEMVRKLEAKMGLTPSDRTGMQVQKPANETGKGRFFETRRAG